jgi:hypothetical protein
MTAAFAGPQMADVMFAHVSRPVWRNQIVIAPDAGNSIRRIALGRDARHDKVAQSASKAIRHEMKVNLEGCENVPPLMIVVSGAVSNVLQ